MPHHPMDRLTQTTVGHHQPKYSVEALKQYWKISFECNQGPDSLDMLALSILDEALEILQ